MPCGARSDASIAMGAPRARCTRRRASGWLPARVTAGLVAAARPAAAREVWDVVRQDAPAHPSPNAGVAEAAFAAALGLRLGGDNRYRGEGETRPPLGRGRPPDVDDIGR